MDYWAKLISAAKHVEHVEQVNLLCRLVDHMPLDIQVFRVLLCLNFSTYYRQPTHHIQNVFILLRVDIYNAAYSSTHDTYHEFLVILRWP